ncbi:hypothetical protein GCM10009120_50000 [Sphingobacterium siyangense subsp. cladoniae]|uniref:hypothetical protein n=1 Tax=Sphingobacterium siyangense TaxID=459529 RepID=UPI0031FA3BFF
MPKHQSKDKEEYIDGVSSTGNPSGAIQRYKFLKHGEHSLKNNGVIAYVENNSIENWLTLINNKLHKVYPNDSSLIPGVAINEYTSRHLYHESESTFEMYHFWINLTDN